MSEIVYTEQQIKDAFWRAFHECSVLYFDSLCGEHANEESTRGHWMTFLEALHKEREPLPLDPLPNAYVVDGFGVALDIVAKWRGATWPELIKQEDGIT